MNAPQISFRNSTSPYAVISSPYIYSETIAQESSLPVLSGDNSVLMTFRIYNNFNTPPSASIATAYNVAVTTYDSASTLTASTQPVSNMWVHIQENGYGEQSSIPGLYTVYNDTDDAVGGTTSTHSFPVGSDGSANSQIRASSGSGVGFIEVNTFTAVPLGVSTNTWSFALVVAFDWNT